MDKPDTASAERAWENQTHIRLYDPPVDGKTPVDGEGAPQSSVIVLRDRAPKLAQGFTTQPVGREGDWPELGDMPVQPQVPAYPGRKAALAANIKRAQDRKHVRKR